MENLLDALMQEQQLVDMVIHTMRYIVPLVSVLLLMRCILPLLTFRKEPEIWAWLNMPDGSQIPITHWENVIGRSKSCDVTIDFPTVSRNHAVLTRYDDGSWTISDAGSKGGVMVNGKKVQICAVHSRSRISIGGVEMQLQPISEKQEAIQAQLRTKAASNWDTVANLLLLTILQVLMTMGFLLSGTEAHLLPILEGFGGIVACQWLLYAFYVTIRRASFEVETLAFFLCTMGMAAIVTAKPGEGNAAKYLCGGLRYCLCHHFRGVGADHGGAECGLHRVSGLLLHPHGPAGKKRLLQHRGLHSCRDPGGSGNTELPGNPGHSALHRRALSHPQQWRHQYDGGLGTAGLCQGGRYPAECQLCRSA